MANAFDIDTIFSGVSDRQQIAQLEEQLVQLQSEIKTLRVTKSKDLSQGERQVLEQQIADLTSKLSQEGGEHEIELRLIDPDPNQPRKVFAKSVIQERAKSLQDNGQLAPIIVMPQPNGRYSLFEGQLRWEGAKQLQWNSLRAVFLREAAQNTSRDRFKYQVITSLHAQKLHDLDLAEAIVQMAVTQCAGLAIRQDDVHKVLNSAIRRLERDQALPDFGSLRMASRSEQEAWINSAPLKTDGERSIFATILELQLNPISINTTAMRLLGLSDDLKVIIRQEGLEGSKARELNRLSTKHLNLDESEANDVRRNITDQVIQQDLSLVEIKKLVEDTIRQYQGAVVPESAGSRFIKQINKMDVSDLSEDDLKELRKALDAKLKEVRSLLTE
jgi:ParB family transcriptional regulator, chromosome partitioning protein